MTALQRVLHVEDDESIRAVTEVALQTVGHLSVLSCAGGREALEKAPAFNPQLILLDVMMPEMDGPSTLRELSALLDLSEIPVLFMTAKVQDKEVAQYRRLGAFDIIVKPFDPMTLADTLKQQWQRFQQQHHG